MSFSQDYSPVLAIEWILSISYALSDFLVRRTHMIPINGFRVRSRGLVDTLLTL